MTIVIMTCEQLPRMLVFVFIIFEDVSLQDEVKDYTNYTLFQLEGSEKELLKILNNVDESASYELRRNISHILIAPEFKARFKEAFNETRLKILELCSDYSKVLAGEKKLSLRDKQFSWDGYYSIDDIYKYLATTQAKFPSWTRVVVGGETYEGRKILGLRISTNVKPGNKPKPIVFIESGIHAREWIAPAVATYLIEQLLTSQHPNITNLRDIFEWHIFPVVNPDGYQYSYTKERLWRKTRSKTRNPRCYGVDANRNFDYNFGGDGTTNNPCDHQIYRGEKAFSEVETRSLANYILKLNKILSYIALHSYFSCIMVPYSDSKEHIPDYSKLVRIAKTASDYSYAYKKIKYVDIGTAAELIHKVTGTSTDWAYKTKKVPLTYILELRGESFFWPTWRIAELGEECTRMVTGIFHEAKRLNYY